MTDSRVPRDLSPPHRQQRATRRLELRIRGIFKRLHDFGENHFHIRRECNTLLRPDFGRQTGGKGPGAEIVGATRRFVAGPSAALRRARIRRFGGEVPPSIDGGVVERIRTQYGTTIGILLCVLAVVASYAFWEVRNLSSEGAGLGGVMETRWATSGEDYMQVGRLIDRLISYETLGVETRKKSLPEDGFIREEVIALMKEFGAEESNVPPEFIKEVGRFIRQYQGPERELMARTLQTEHGSLERIREILRRDNIPPDLAYMALVESGFLRSSSSPVGAVGVWQFTEETAREYGMEVNENVDERLDLSKSTEAASHYMRDLILDFGTGSSVMLAIAAYNSGPEKVRRAMRNVKDPIKQRNFWYLYQTQALPDETRHYVPKVIAAIVIGRNPERFGF